MRLIRLIGIFILAVSLVVPVLAQALPSDAITVTPAFVDRSSGHYELTLKVAIKKTYHINANPASESFLIPTSVEITSAQSLLPGAIIYPKPQMVTFAFTSGKKIAVYADEAMIVVPLATNGVFKPTTIKGKLNYQACDEHSCYAPASQSFSIDTSTATASATPAAEATSPAGSAPSDRLSGLLSTGNLATAIPLIFLLGLLLNLTPCVYPIIPITIAFFARQSEQSTKKQLGLSGMYVLGMALMYSALGTAAAILGKTFGFQLQNPWVVGGFAAVLIALALSMFGLYELQMPASWRNKSKLRNGHLGALTMGMLVGIAAAPCVGPVVVALATAVSASGSILLGFTLFFVLGLGLGSPYLLLGAYSSKIKSLPRSGDWMIAVERIFGLMLLCTAVFLLQPILPKGWEWSLPAVIALCGIYLNLVDRHAAQLKGFSLFKRALGLAAVLAAMWMLKPGAVTSDQHAWTPYSAQLQQQSITDRHPVVLDFYADWCIPCKELDAQTFRDPEVQRQLSNMTTLKINLTREDTPLAQMMKQRYGIKGVPTIVFIDRAGNERRDLRLTGFEPATQFSQRLRKID
ncbi:MAG: protein-disulfide reductase DsbD family protein [Armatimonadota bacterium]